VYRLLDRSWECKCKRKRLFESAVLDRSIYIYIVPKPSFSVLPRSKVTSASSLCEELNSSASTRHKYSDALSFTMSFRSAKLVSVTVGMEPMFSVLFETLRGR
jgi:hypothetical protein